MTCTAAVIIAFLGAMPPKGTVVTVPRSALSQYSAIDIAKAKICAARYRIRWQIDEEK